MVDRGRIELPTPGFSVGKRTALNRPVSTAIGANLLSHHAFQAPLAKPAHPFEPMERDRTRQVGGKSQPWSPLGSTGAGVPLPARTRLRLAAPSLTGRPMPAQDRGSQPALGVAPGPAGALTCTRPGAVDAMPSREEVLALMNRYVRRPSHAWWTEWTR